MLTAVLTAPQRFELRDLPIPAVGQHDIRIKVKGCGICASSIPVWEGREWFNYPLDPGSPGHEGWGIVDAVGVDITDVDEGDWVAYLSYHAYAEYDLATKGAYVKLPPAVGGKPFPGEPLGCAMNIFNRSDIGAGDIVAIVGIGFLGALLCQLAKAAGAKVIAVSHRPFSLQVAIEQGADNTVQLTDTWNTAAQVKAIVGDAGCKRVIETTGKQVGVDVSTALVAEGGRLIIAGFHQDGMRQVNMQDWNWKGIDVINAHERDPARYLSGMQLAVDAVANGILQPETLYTHRFSLPEIETGFALTASRPEGFVKAIIII